LVVKTNRQRVVAIGVTLILISGCATGRQIRSGQQAAKAGEWDAAVAFYRAALARDPNRIDVKISLQRATVAASAEHMVRAKELEAQEQWSAAAAEYRLAADLDPANVFAVAKAVSIEQRLRAEIEKMRPPSRMDTLREQARQTSAMPTLIDPQQPIDVRFTNTSVREILTSIGTMAGINVTFVENPTIGPQLGRAYSIDLRGESLESALNQVLNANQLTFKVINPRGILVYGSDQTGRQAHDDVFVQVFYLSHVEATEMGTLLTTLTQQTQGGSRPQITQNKNTNALTVRATMPVLQVFDQIIRANDKPKAEVLIDVEILEVDRLRVKEMGLNLSQYSLGFAFSPEVPPGTAFSPPPFNLNTVSQGVSTADFYATVPTALIRMLEEDRNTRLLARPQLRGQERSPLSLNLGDDIPVPQTTFAAQVAGGLATTPTTSFQYRTVGVVLTINPQVSFDGEIILDVTVESSRRGQDVTINDQTLPSFGTRKAQTKLRMRDGESNLLAGLIKEEDRDTNTGFPGLNRIPFLRSLFGGSETSRNSSDIVMIITPRILRSQELTAADMAPMYVGTGNNFGASSTPPLISPQAVSGGTTAPPPVGTPAAAGTQPSTPPAGQQAAPPPAPATPPASRAVGIVPVTGADAPATPPATASGPTRVTVTPPATALQMGGQPYNVPLTMTNAAGLSSLTLTVTYNPAVLRAVVVNEGSIMRADGSTTSFVPKIDATSGRIDVVISRPGDKTGAMGNGLLGSVVFEAIAAGTSQISLSGIGLTAAGQPVSLQFVPAMVTVR
jgi:general secretion pathway protein D